MQRSDLIHKMKENAEKVQTVVSIIENFKAAVQYTVALTKHQGGTTVTAPDLTASELDVLKNHCEKEGLTFLAVPLRAHAENIHTALTYADWGIAETGTLVMDACSENLRIATMLSDIHVAVLPAEKIKPTSEALENKLNNELKGNSASYIAFITGASRTADIERVLAIGVHGPIELHILIMEGLIE
jgi:L-lactate dehydrogenase complex protein LldG